MWLSLLTLVRPQPRPRMDCIAPARFTHTPMYLLLHGKQLSPFDQEAFRYPAEQRQIAARITVGIRSARYGIRLQTPSQQLNLGVPFTVEANDRAVPLLVV